MVITYKVGEWFPSRRKRITHQPLQPKRFKSFLMENKHNSGSINQVEILYEKSKEHIQNQNMDGD